MLGTRPADKRQNGHACPFCRSAACYETPTAPDRVASCASPAVPTTQLLFFQAQLIERDVELFRVGPPRRFRLTVQTDVWSRDARGPVWPNLANVRGKGQWHTGWYRPEPSGQWPEPN